MTAASLISRRHALQVLSGGAALAVGVGAAQSREKRILRLIERAGRPGSVSRRIDFISQALIGTRYRGYTLVGGPHRPEEFVARDDGFDCVTFCETVLAAAIAGEPSAFEPTLRAIRYHNGVVAWRERNHYFFEWRRHNIENGMCRAIDIGGTVAFDRTVDWLKALGPRRFAMQVIPGAAFLAHKGLLLDGDIVGFVTRRPNLDYFHVGFVAFGRRGEFLLRHASRRHGRVVDESMARFVAANGVPYVTLLRPLEPTVMV
jgi:hypothetical protein